MKTYYIYYIYFSCNNPQIYIGYTGLTPEERFQRHCRKARNGSKHHFCNALRKYGPKNAKVRVLMTLEGFTRNQAEDLEIWWISRCDTFKGVGYNETRGGIGYIIPKEAKGNNA